MNKIIMKNVYEYMTKWLNYEMNKWYFSHLFSLWDNFMNVWIEINNNNNNEKCRCNPTSNTYMKNMWWWKF